MLKINEVVLYGADGACRVKEFCKKRIAGEEHDYAVLETEAAPKTTIYLPLGNKTLLNKVRPVLSPEEMVGLIREVPEQAECWIEDESQRKQHHREILSSCERIALIGLIKTLYKRQQEQQGHGKKLHSADERTLREAQRLLHNEISFVMRIPPEQVGAFLSSELLGPMPQMKS